jgi:hypothetical protein
VLRQIGYQIVAEDMAWISEAPSFNTADPLRPVDQ